MKKISSYEIALSALACAIATIFLTIGVYSSVLLFTGYLLAGIALMLPLAKQSYTGYVLAYIATCILSLIFNVARFFDLLPKKEIYWLCYNTIQKAMKYDPKVATA